MDAEFKCNKINFIFISFFFQPNTFLSLFIAFLRLVYIYESSYHELNTIFLYCLKLILDQDYCVIILSLNLSFMNPMPKKKKKKKSKAHDNEEVGKVIGV